MTAFTPRNVLVFGGTGTIGKYITSALLSSPVHVTLFTSLNTYSTKSALLTSWENRGVSIITGDITSASDVTAAYKGIDTVISAVGRGALQHQIQLIKLAEESDSVQWFFPSEYGTDVEYGEKSKDEKPHQLKLKVRNYVRDDVKKLKVTYVVTGPYFDMWVNTIPAPGLEVAGGYVPSEKKAYVVEGDKKVGFCTMVDVGRFVAAALKHPEESFGKALKVQSFVVTPNEVVKEYERQTGEKWEVVETALDEHKKLETRLWEESHPAAVSATLRRIWAEGGTLYAKNDNEAVGLGEKDLDSLEVAVKKALAGGYKNDTF